MARRKILVLSAMILLMVGGFAGYEAWKELTREQAGTDMAITPGCSVCSHVKKDLAEKVRLREQQSEQVNENPPDSP